MMIAWLATARADDLLDRDVRFQISASPLASALIEFSTESGIQVAAADADVARLNSNGVNGTLPVRAALSALLLGTGLEFSRVGPETVAIRRASILPTLPGGTLRATGTPAVQASQPQPHVNAGTSPEVPDVSITNPTPPTEQELAGDSLYQFITHHATVHYVSTPTTRNLARWRGGKQSICPLTVGLDPGYNAFVTARLRALAVYVGAPVQSDPQCENNVQIVFTTNPKARMDDVVKWATAPSSFGIRYSGGMRDLLAYRSDQAIQGWYITTRGGAIVLNTDVALVGLDVLPVWPQIAPKYYVEGGRFGSGLGGGGGSSIGIGIVILVVDTTKVVGYPIGTIADYLAMLTLSVVQSPDHCDPLPSILDLMSSSCSTREKPTAITAGDLAFLKALYYRNTGLGPSLSRSAIQDNMMQQFKLR
jgi:secretin/TonB-like protein